MGLLLPWNASAAETPGKSSGVKAHLSEDIRLPKDLPESVTVGSVLAAISDQFPFGIARPADPEAEARPLELSGSRLGLVLDAVAHATGTTWEPVGADVVFRPRTEQEPVYRLLRQEGLLRAFDDVRVANRFLRSLERDAFADLAATGFLSFERLTAAQRAAVRSLPSAMPRPRVKDVSLLELPEKDLVVLAGCFLHVRVEPAPGVRYQVVLHAGEGSSRLDPFLRPRRALTWGIPDPVRKPPPPADESAAPPPNSSGLTLADVPVPLKPRAEPIYSLTEVASAVRAATRQEVFVDRRLGDVRVRLTPGRSAWTSHRLMALAAGSTGFAWRQVGPTYLLVRHLHGERPSPASFSAVLTGERQSARLTLGALAQDFEGNESPSLPTLSGGEGAVRWGDLKPAQQRVLRTALRGLAEKESDERLARFLWHPAGMKDAVVRSSPGVFLLLGARPDGELVEEAWGVVGQVAPDQK
jgi:hypothetical protein